MTPIDWTIVLALNGPIVLWALFASREARTSSEWFLAGRSLAWWTIGLSLFATAIDASDIVADSGGAYRYGMGIFAVSWVGTVLGWFLMAHRIALPMYRAGLYTNAEYLEVRFGPAARILSVFVQLQYRSLVLCIMTKTIHLTLSIVCGWSDAFTWAVVVAVALLAAIYTMLGGLRSVALTDAFQSAVMIVASAAVFLVVWVNAGGWRGLESRLAAEDPELPARMLHVGAERIEHEDTAGLSAREIELRVAAGGDHLPEKGVIERRTPGWLVCLSFTLLGIAYAVVNHTQAMRLLGARSVRDIQLAVVLSGTVLIVITFLNLSMGLFGRALHPELAATGGADRVYPLLVRDFAAPGLTGLVVAGILAASFSTYDSIGATLSALLTRDVYVRLVGRGTSDRHQVLVARLLVPAIIFGSFLYLPLIEKKGMWGAYLEVVGATVIPLLAVYLLGAFTRVHPRSGTIGLCAGLIWGVWALAAPVIAGTTGVALLPAALMDPFATAPVSLLVTAVAMFVASAFLGQATGPLPDTAASPAGAEPQERREALPLVVLGLLVVAAGAVLAFVVFW